MIDETACDYSRLTVPNHMSYVGVACAYVGQVAEKFGFDAEDRDQLCAAIAEAVSNVVQHAFEPGRQAFFDITCERVPLGMRIVIRDQGIPFDPTPFMTDTVCAAKDPSGASGLCLMKEHVDHVEFHNLGKDGKEIVLIKYAKSPSIEDYHQACELVPYVAVHHESQLPGITYGGDSEGEMSRPVRSRPGAEPPETPPEQLLPHDPPDRAPVASRARFTVTVAPMRSDQAIEVCKTLYKAYGYTYFYPHMYYPDRIKVLNNSGQLFSAVAITDRGDIAGHAALIKTRPDDRIAEMGIAAVKPEYRSSGVLVRMAEFLMDKARADGLMGLFDQAVTNHTYSQQAALRAGFRDSAICLAYVPTSSSFKHITEKLSFRVPMVVQFQYLNKPQRTTAHFPIRHKDMLTSIYAELGVVPEPDTGDEASCVEVEHPTVSEEKNRAGLLGNGFVPERFPGVDSASRGAVVRTEITTVMGLARIHVENYGETVVAEVKTRLKDLCLKKFEVIYLYLDLSNPLTSIFTDRFEELGFFFAGLLPGAARGDALILQYLNNVPVDYDEIRIKSETGRVLLDYVKQHDPNRR